MLMTLDAYPDRRRLMQLSLVAAGAGLVSGGTAGAASDLLAEPRVASDAAHDFDLFYGSWHVKHRRLKERLAGSSEWIDFDGTCVMQPMLGGCGNVDDNVFNFPPGPFRGISVRAFDPATKNWSIWWLDSR